MCDKGRAEMTLKMLNSCSLIDNTVPSPGTGSAANAKPITLTIPICIIINSPAGTSPQADRRTRLHVASETDSWMVENGKSRMAKQRTNTP